VTIPAIRETPGPKINVAVRLSAEDVSAIQVRAEDEELLTRDGFGNRSALIQLALAYYLRNAPVGWRPENGNLLP
jgi:hypothetical protein